jgi:DNA-directed RNA polymerase subunit RPC12/RpoP
MSTEWFYQDNADVVGPLKPAELLAGVRRGLIQEESLVRKDDSQWVAAWEVDGLFAAAKRDLVQYLCPYCKSRVTRPPTTCIECSREVTAVYRKREVVAEMPADHEIEQQKGAINWIKSLFARD